MSTSLKLKGSLDRSYENKIKSDSFKFIIGVDEAGRGPLAGPVVAAACVVEEGVCIDGIDDSKSTTEADREQVYEILTSNPKVRWGVSVVSNDEIDTINILQASLTAMSRATADLLSKCKGKKLGTLTKSSAKWKRAISGIDEVESRNCLALIDGNKLPSDANGWPHDVSFRSVVKGDSLCYSIAAASIIAKVTRDRIMYALDELYPNYLLAQHKGYPTAMHRKLLQKHGPSDIHRKTYAPVKAALEVHKNRLVRAKCNSRSSTLVASSSSTGKRNKTRDPARFQETERIVDPPSSSNRISRIKKTAPATKATTSSGSIGSSDNDNVPVSISSQKGDKREKKVVETEEVVGAKRKRGRPTKVEIEARKAQEAKEAKEAKEVKKVKREAGNSGEKSGQLTGTKRVRPPNSSGGGGSSIRGIAAATAKAATASTSPGPGPSSGPVAKRRGRSRKVDLKEEVEVEEVTREHVKTDDTVVKGRNAKKHFSRPVPEQHQDAAEDTPWTPLEFLQVDVQYASSSDSELASLHGGSTDSDDNSHSAAPSSSYRISSIKKTTPIAKATTTAAAGPGPVAKRRGRSRKVDLKEEVEVEEVTREHVKTDDTVVRKVGRL